MRWRFAALLLAAWCACPAAARADSFDPVSFGVDVSTLGYGITLERPLLFNLSARLTTGELSAALSSGSSGGGSWQGSFHENNVLLAADWRPYGGRWYLSGGALLGSDHVDAVAQPAGGNVTLDYATFPLAGTGTVTVRTSYAQPSLYLGAGGGTGILKGLAIAFDAGVVIRNGSVTRFATGPLQSNAAFQTALAAAGGATRAHFLQPVLGVGLLFRP
jgi:hypothetical protein